MKIARRWKRVWWQVAAAMFVLLLIVGIPLLVLYGDIIRAASELPAARAAARRADLPVEADEVRRGPKLAPEDNAASLVREAGKYYRSSPSLISAKTKLDSTVYSADKATREALTPAQVLPLFEPFEPAYDLARRAAKKSACDFEYDWSQGPDLLFPEPEIVKRLVKDLSARAEYFARAGRLDEALADLGVAWQLGRLIGQEPSTIHLLVEIACESIILKSYERVIEHSADDAARLKLVQMQLGALGPLPDLHNACRGEAFFMVQLSRRIRSWRDFYDLMKPVNSGDPSSYESDRIPRQGAPTVLSRGFECRALQYITERENRVRDKLDAHSYLESQLAMDKAEQLRTDPSHLLNRVLMPLFDRVCNGVLKTDANRRCIRALAVAMEFRAKHGRPPKSLAEIGLHEIDPFDHQPLRYKATATSICVYSVGEDLVDDGGRRTKPSGELTVDVAAEFTTSSKRR